MVTSCNGLERAFRGLKVMQLDNRGSHYYLALFWAEATCVHMGLQGFRVDIIYEIIYML